MGSVVTFEHIPSGRERSRCRRLLVLGFGRSELEFVEAGDDAVIVVAHPRAAAGDDWPEEAATVITFREGKVVDMQDYRTRDEALTAVSAS